MKIYSVSLFVVSILMLEPPKIELIQLVVFIHSKLLDLVTNFETNGEDHMMT